MKSDVLRVAVVLVSQNRFAALEKNLESFRSLPIDSEDLIFVDNGSRENLKKWVDERLPGITTIRLPENRLFCGGYNAGIRLGLERDCEFILISNADTEVINPCFLKDLLNAADRWPQAAFLGPLVFWRSADVIQKTCLEFPSVWPNSLRWLPSRLSRNGFEKQPQEEAAVGFLNGVCVLCRSQALREIGLMDENMGGYVEDADWAWRAKEKGWVSVFTPVPSVIHYETASGYEWYSLKTFLLKRNTAYWYLKVGKWKSAWTYSQASIILAIFRFLMERQAEERHKHRYFLQRLMRAFEGLLRGEALGEWFGPPIGSWESENGF